MVNGYRAMNTVDELREAYQSTWREFADKLTALQQLRQTGPQDNRTIEAAVLDLETARLAYGCARDLLAERLQEGLAESAPAIAIELDESRVSAAAHLLWDLAGRPEGTAERDWNRARELVCAASR